VLVGLRKLLADESVTEIHLNCGVLLTGEPLEIHKPLYVGPDHGLNTNVPIIIGAGAGLSTAAGFIYSGERFERWFPDFIWVYGIEDMYSGGFYPYPSKEIFWAYWARYIYINRYMDPPKPVYDDLFSLVKNKDYFVITTNVDHCFQKAGFDKKRLFYTQGDYGLFQSTDPRS